MDFLNMQLPRTHILAGMKQINMWKLATDKGHI